MEQKVSPDEWDVIRSMEWAGLKRLGSHGMAGTARTALQYCFDTLAVVDLWLLATSALPPAYHMNLFPVPKDGD